MQDKMERLLDMIHRRRLQQCEVFNICLDINQELRKKSRFARMQAKEWDKLSEEADTALDQATEKFAGIRRATGIARIQTTVSPAKSETRSERRHRLALEKAAAAPYKKQIQAAEAEYVAAEAEYSNTMITWDSRYWAQAVLSIRCCSRH